MPRKVEKISLKPDTGESLTTLKLAKSEFVELFTYNTHVKVDDAVTENHPDFYRTAAANTNVETAKTAYAQSATSGPPIPLPKNVASFDNKKNKNNEEPSLRVIVCPGQPPFAKPLLETRLEFDVPKLNGHDQVSNAFEDTCNLAMRTNKLDSIQDASFITDTATLSYLYHVLQERDANKSYSQKLRGISIAVHDVKGSTFLKLLNPHAIDGNYGKAAAKHLKQEALKHRWQVGGDELRDSFDLNVYKQVISYRLGNYDFVVEDLDQASVIDDGTHRLRESRFAFQLHRLVVKELPKDDASAV
ncbi:hypothetical protein K449DRAFT_256457 [Hypoxylon sp. EC38]|nr:hypothetical protein K449DRAFT_256457 [Hypoxylon sp. EC38]